MNSWLYILLFSPVVPYAAPAPQPPTEYYVGVVAAEAAYATLPGSVPDTPAPTPAPPVDPKNCPTCKNSGRPGWVRTGDDQGWTKCPTCQPANAETTPAPAPPAQGFPPRTTPPRADCPTGKCPRQKDTAPQSPTVPAGPVIPVIPYSGRFFRRK